MKWDLQIKKNDLRDTIYFDKIEAGEVLDSSSTAPGDDCKFQQQQNNCCSIFLLTILVVSKVQGV